MRRFLLILCAAATLLATVSSAQDDAAERQKELERIRKEIESHRTQTKKLSSQEQQTVKKLQNLDKEIDAQKRYLKKLNEQESTIDQQIGGLRIAIANRESALTRQETALGKRLRELYKQDPRYKWEFLMGANSMSQIVDRYAFMKLIAEQDAQLIGDVRESKRSLETESSRLGESLEQISAVRSDKERETTELANAKKQRQVALTQIRSEKSKHTTAIKELEVAQARVQSILDDIARRGVNDKDLPPSGEFASLKGRLLWPVNGKVIRGFGKHTHPKYGTVTMNNGLDIQAPAGAPIVAVAGGVVEFVDWIDAFGKCVILNHGGGYYTLYAHVAATMVTQGQKVGRGQAIAEVGDTGSLEGYVCHFEVRQARKALNPMDWLGKKASS